MILYIKMICSPGFLRLVDVLVEMEPIERKAFLQFATGCSSLPPGGLANLHPRLTVVRKVKYTICILYIFTLQRENFLRLI